MKDSIKREQSQAGLSFAERKNFRPKVKRNKLLLLLALLMTAATGAWADNTYTVTFKANGNTKTVENVTLPHTFSCDFNNQNGELDHIIQELYGIAQDQGWCDDEGYPWMDNAVSGVTADHSGDNHYITISTPFEGTAQVKGWYYRGYENDFQYTLDISIAAASAGSGYTVSMKDGVKDADKWTVKVGEGQAQALPIGGLKGDGSETVTLQYNGRLKVKGVKATSDAAPAAPASTPLDNTTTAWTAGTFAVPAGGLTYSDAITVSGNVTLTLTEGETLTLNKGISLAEGATLTVQGNGTMTVNGSDNSTASTVAGSTGTLVLTSGTLTATGGNGQSLTINWSMDDVDNITGASGGVAINGNVTVSGGTVTATGGNGGNLNTSAIGGGCDNNHGGNGGAAISGSVTVNGGTWTATNGSNGTYTSASGDYRCSAGTGSKAVAGTVTDNRN